MKYFPSIVQVKFLYWIACVNGQYFCTPDSVWGCKYSQLCSCLIRHSCANGLSDSIRTHRTSRTYSVPLVPAGSTTTSEHENTHKTIFLVVLKTHRGKQCGMGETHPERHGIFPSVPTPHFMNKTFLHKNVWKNNHRANNAEEASY